MRTKTNRIDLRVDDMLYRRIEAWRQSQPGPPSLTAALLHLVNLGLEVVGPRHDDHQIEGVEGPRGVG